MSRPDSTIVVQTRTSNSFSQKSTMTCSSASSPIWPCADRDPRLGHQLAQPRAPPGRSTRPGCGRRRPGPRAAARAGSRRPICFSSYGADEGQHRVPLLRRGGIVDISRMPVTAISSVRGIGVADIVSTSTLVRSFLRCSLCSTPKRCSSSTMTRPRSLNLVVGCSSRWVPMTTSTVPSREPARRSRSASVSRLEPGQRRDRHRELRHTARRTCRSAAGPAASSAPGRRPACRPAPP